MPGHLIPASLLALAAATLDPPAYRGRAAETSVEAPRVDATIRIDGRLEEAVWAQAARLTEFTQYSPVDGRPAEQVTEVLLWYSPTAIHFGVRATAEPGSVRAHLAERDRGIIPDDYIELQLGTFNDGRQAFVFGVNPLGVQADGALIEGTQRRGGLEDRAAGREQADLSPDYVWDSKGRLTESGYELEVRIPFKSLRYQRADPQDWSLQIIRKTAAWGREDTWAPTRRGAASFLAQHGKILGLTGLQRGLVLELNPVVTSSVVGARPETGAPWQYAGGGPEFGGSVKWGISTDVNLNGTANPDFSQIEADASQISPDPRRAIFFQEKRPFFLDGLEYFSTPLQLIYTRRVVAPVAAVRLTGRAASTNFGLLSAVDDRELSGTGDHPIYNLVRVQRDVGRQSRVGFAYTDRIDGDAYNRVGLVDTRLVFGGVYSLSAHGAMSWSRRDGVASRGPAWSLAFARTGRTFGVQATFRGLDPDFAAGSGFIDRENVAQINVGPSLTAYGKRGALLERFTGSVSADWLWNYNDLFDGRGYLERKVITRTSWSLRGGWSLSASLLVERFAYDPRLYEDYAIELPGAAGLDTIPYNDRNLPSLPNLDLSLNIDSPQIHGFELNGFMIVGKDENFHEWSSANIWFGRLGLAFRPTERLRFDGSLSLISYRRRTDGTIAGDTYIPRIKVEYQVSRSIFLRMVGEYSARRRDDLRDDGRTDAPILLRDPEDGVYKRDLALGFRQNDFRVDWLFSLQPSPGTVFFAGYGSSLREDRAFRFGSLERLNDGFFTKFSYLFRL